ncbi:CPBP family intramembrane glutamic endopeptidase [Planomicrobium sp. CPCC 101110]|uniref:CPBP family intramembrane glutamic endopeptidase n=1 Tax=Planomicrobium sp. CPCC 101110 TaxID=2599619 RepID=UPI0011B4F2EE|nr:CPBP family intramembrane glutamic endopeptidase [Planomicrobium sp. CPCC 101110]TWT25212.1 CPBP family intramembrane metalloprotease [Planomicrobium sp. CPCC 101110]
MKNALRLVGPSLMILIGLQFFENVVITFLLFFGWLCLVPLIDKAFPKERMKLDKQALLVGVGSGVVFFLFVYGGASWLHVYLLDINKLRVLLLDWGFAGPLEFAFILLFVFVNPVLEEVYWRGYMYEKLRIKGTAAYAIIMTSIFYTLYHVLTVLHLFQSGYTLVAVLPVLLVGLFWAYIREKTGSITATIIGHSIADFAIMCVYWFIVRQ